MAEIFTEIVRPSARVGTRRWYTVPLSIVVHAALLALLIAVPLVATGTLPLPASVLVFAAPAPPAPPELPRAAEPPKSVAAASTPAPPSGPPTEAPSTIQPESPSFAMTAPGAVGLPPGVPAASIALPGPVVAAPPPAAPAEPLRPGGQIKEPVRIHDAAPFYPVLALKAKVSGSVTIEATIDTDGRVIDAKVTRSVPLLDQAALDAVRQWRYRPTLLNGVPVSILMTVTVTFALR